MSTDRVLPKSYKPYRRVVFCSNYLIDVTVPFEIEGNIPLLIGTKKGKPTVWLNAPSKEEDQRWQPIVRANRTMHPAVSVKGIGTRTLSIRAAGAEVLKLVEQADGIPEVIQVDLRPFGINIQGDSTGLMVGGSRFAGNTFQNIQVMIKLGADRPEVTD